MQSPIYFHSDRARLEMFEVVQNLPSGVEVYLVGGALRNALISKYHDETWQQRDYDQIVTKNSDEYLSYLYDRGFTDGTLQSSTQRVIAKPVVEGGKLISYEDNIVFDIHTLDGTSVEDNLRYKSGLLVNGFALSLRDVFTPDWEDALIQLPGALDCIRTKQIRINQDGFASEANNFFACMRFIGAGFSAPPRDEITKLLLQLPELGHERYQRNLEKLSNYVGGESQARRIIEAAIGSDIDIFDEASAKNAIALLA